jgi:hypothetical protein
MPGKRRFVRRFRCKFAVARRDLWMASTGGDRLALRHAARKHPVRGLPASRLDRPPVALAA